MSDSPLERQWRNFHPVRLGDRWGVLGDDGMDYRLLCDNLTYDGAVFFVNALLNEYAPDKVLSG